MSVSIIIPVHNESAHVESAVDRFLAQLGPTARALLTEIILVENGSRDDTWAIIQRMAEREPLLRPISIARGSYGEAIRTGMLAARGRWLSILELDFLDTGFVEQSWQMMQRGDARFVVASKRTRGSVDERPWLRRVITQAFNAVLRVVVGYDGTDTHGLKTIDTALAQELCGLAITTDEALQTEIVLIAARRGCPIVELPISIREVRPAPVKVLARAPKALAILWDLRRSLRRFPRRSR